MADRCTIVLFNTVERLLRGDFFHVSEMEDVTEALNAFPKSWSVVGVGTSNWYRRNGELVQDPDVPQLPLTEVTSKLIGKWYSIPESNH